MTWRYPSGLGARRLANLGLRLDRGPDPTEVDVFELRDLSSGRRVALPSHNMNGSDLPRFTLRPNQPSVLLSAVQWLEINNLRPEVLQD